MLKPNLITISTRMAIIQLLYASFLIAGIPEEIAESLELQVETELSSTCNELLDKEKICKELSFTWPLSSPEKGEAELLQETQKKIAKRSEEEFPSTLTEKFKEEAAEMYRTFEIGDLVLLTLKNGETVEGYFRARSNNILMIDNNKVSLPDLEDSGLTHFNSMIQGIKIKEYVRGRLADLKDKKANFETEIRDRISHGLYKKNGYIQVNGEWIAKNSFIESTLRERKEKLKEKLKPLVVSQIYYDAGYVLYNDEWMTTENAMEMRKLAEENAKSVTQDQKEQGDIDEDESGDTEGGLWD